MLLSSTSLLYYNLYSSVYSLLCFSTTSNMVSNRWKKSLWILGTNRWPSWKNLTAFQRRILFYNKEQNVLFQSLTFDTVHSAPPTVLVSSRHTPGAGKLDASYNSIATWVEVNRNLCVVVVNFKQPFYQPLEVCPSEKHVRTEGMEVAWISFP